MKNNSLVKINNIFFQDTIANGMQLMLLIETDDIFTAYTKDKDYYYYVINRFKEKYPDYAKELSIYEPKKQRAIFKRGIMTIAYGATEKTIMNYIQEKLDEYNYVSNTGKKVVKGWQKFDIITEVFTKNLRENYARYLTCVFVPLLKKYLKAKHSLVAKNFGINVDYTYPLFRRKVFRYWFNKRKKSIIIINKKNKVDITKTCTATYVNMIHSVEAEICRHLINKFEYIATIHDCYGVPFHQMKELRVTYKNKLIYNDSKQLAFKSLWPFWIWTYKYTPKDKITDFTGLEKKGNYLQFLIRYRRLIKERGERLKNEIPDEKLFS